MEAALAAAAARRGGLFSRSDALAAGYSPAQVRHRLATGKWTVLRRGTYVDAQLLAGATAAARHAWDVAAASRALEFPTVASSWSALRLHELEMRGTAPPGVWLACWRRGSAGSRRMPDVTLQPAALWPDHLTRAYGVPLTSPATTGIDLARRLPFESGVVILDSVLRRTTCSLEQLRRILHDCQDWPGSLAAARALEFADPASESVLETLGRVFMHRFGLPRPQTQVVLGDDWGRRARVDYWWPEHRTIGEADGMAKYDGLATLRAEKRREDWLRGLGYEVVRFDWDDVTRWPTQTAARFRAAFDRGDFRARYERANRGPAADAAPGA